MGFLLSSAWAATPQRGYVPRACSFDMDDDGVVGEPEDCNVGDGVTLDPDGDGVDEDLIYVDCDAGSNSVTCGAPASPCRTLEYTLGVRADGSNDGAEDIVAFAGTCSPSNLVPSVGGLATTKVRPATGSEERDWLLPADPAMVIGWDRDDDGAYPPFDPDDHAELDGTGLVRAFNFNGSNGAYFEMAHFTAREYGRTGVGDGGFAIVSRPHNYWHDISLIDVNRGMNSDSGRVVFNFFYARSASYFWLKNVECLDCGGYFTRGGPGEGLPESGPWRFQNVHLVQHPCSYGSSPECNAQPYSTASKLWGWITGIEWLDSVIDGAPENRNLGNHTSHWPQGTTVAQCVQDYLVRNNEFINVRFALHVQGSAAGACENANARPVDDVVFDRNVVRLTTDKFLFAPIQMSDGGNSAGELTADVTITNSVFIASGAGRLQACLMDEHSNTGVPIPGTLVYVNNSCLGTQVDFNGRGGGILIVSRPGNRQDDWIVKNNVFNGATSGSSKNIAAEYLPTNWQADYNVFNAAATYLWGGSSASTLPAFRALSGGDDESRECEPVFTSDGYHLAAGDACAQDAGTDLTGLVDADIDVDPRGLGAGWDVGADEAGVALFADGFESGDLAAWSTAVQ